ncbi:unnamed protein product [Symbiodinium microadriaticum]|nr:unnamed protein product [Symbiodinium microadriaticum]
MREVASAGNCREHGGCSSATDCQMTCQTDEMQITVSVVWMSGATLLRMMLDRGACLRSVFHGLPSDRGCLTLLAPTGRLVTPSSCIAEITAPADKHLVLTASLTAWCARLR